MKRSIKLLLVICIVGSFVAAGLFVLRYREALLSRLTAEGRRERILRRLNMEDIHVERNCGRGHASVSGARWQALPRRDQDRAIGALAYWCNEQSGVNTLTVRDADTGEVLALWNGAAVERTVR